MLTRHNLSKLRRVIAETKIYINRTQTYMAPFQLFMIFLIFLNTTVWNVSAVQVFFGSKMSFICVGIVVFIIGVVSLGYADTKLKVFKVEQSSYNNPSRNPFTEMYLLTLLMSTKGEPKLEQKVKEIFYNLKSEELYEKYCLQSDK